MFRKSLAIVGLCCALPAWPATHPVDGSFDSTRLAARTDDGAALPAWVARSDFELRGDGPGSAALDDFGTTALQEPTTLAMMAAGVVGLLGLGVRRRRRA